MSMPVSVTKPETHLAAKSTYSAKIVGFIGTWLSPHSRLILLGRP